ncbi:MAG: CoB--CoM heterodisulfide reductase subunit C [Thermoprotei archaeon]|nr:MAG: CoB--CoM heterodisulfide reductase subunit C [Thermoprotei archaeon]RLF22835.1 MAG: CoB--CoM heterodisulfide reductase subunit C [Thermoprotei archaeon]
MSTLIKPQELDTSIRDLAKQASDKIVECIQCATCSGSCPSGRRTALRTRVVVRQALLGVRDVLSSDDIWLCVTCYNCSERCPRGIEIVDVIIALRNEAVRRGFMRSKHKDVAKLFIAYGHSVPIDDARRQLRRKLGLTEVPPTTHMYPEALAEVKEILAEIGFVDLVSRQ